MMYKNFISFCWLAFVCSHLALVTGQAPEYDLVRSFQTCEGQDLSITCPGGYFITFSDVSHGRWDNTTCVNEVITDLNGIPCSQDGVGAVIREACDGQQLCTVVAADIEANNSGCNGLEPYVIYSYTCSIPTFSNFACQQEDLILSCPQDTVIHVTEAFYGRNDDVRCDYVQGESTSCMATGVQEKVTELCDGKSSCVLDADSLMLDDPCPDTSKYLDVMYACAGCFDERNRLDCIDWSSAGQCEDNLAWMTAYCREQCWQCPPPEGVCNAVNRQHDETCDFYARIGDCDSFPDWMNYNCEKSCTCPALNGVVLVPSDRAVDVSPAQDGGIMKDIIRPGYGQDYAPDGAVLHTHYYGRLTNGSRFDASRFRNNMLVFTVGVAFGITGWEEGLPTMKRGEVALLFITPEYGYGTRGYYGVPPNSTLVIEVQLYGWRETCSNHETSEEQCEIYRSNGGCESHYLTRLKCRRTCNLCNIPDSCVNTHSNDTQCDVWAREGLCDEANNVTMLQVCARSCAHCPDQTQPIDSCNDLHPVEANCEYWANIGECTEQDSMPYMHGSCRRTCALCTPDQPPPVDETCVNTFDNASRCAYWASIGECVNPEQKDWMFTNCARACSNCEKAPCENSGTLTDYRCDYWVSRGECTGTNRDWMSRSCRQSCDRCVEFPDDSATYIDVSPDQNRGVLKRVIRAGLGTETPPVGSIIYTHYVGTLANFSTFSTSRDDQTKMWIFQLGLEPQQSISGWEFAVPTMKRGEVAEITIQSEYAYGAGGTANGNIPPNSVLTIVIELFDWRDTCHNVRDECDTWAADGDCDSRADWMNIYCKRSCNTCQQPDTCQNVQPDENCDIWAAAGECDLNIGWIRNNCARSCGFCDEQNECKNAHTHVENCYFWRSENECTSVSTRNWMEANCEQTCEFCISGDNCVNAAGDEDCDNWASIGECDRNFDWMTSDCQLACDRCSYEDDGCSGENLYADSKLCQSWALSGECDTNPTFMFEECARSCNFNCPQPTLPPTDECVNYDDRCQSWADDDECDANVGWMLENCPLSCDPSCNNTEPGECVNQYENCVMWATDGECQSNPQWMLENCQASCNSICLEDEPVAGCVNVADDADCDGWAAAGDCISSSNWMMDNCKKSCYGCVDDEFDYCFNNYSVAKQADCEYWESIGECTNTPPSSEWMLTNCRQECGACADIAGEFRNLVCDRDSQQMRCDDGYFIHAKRVFYGRQDRTTCVTDQMLTDDCVSPSRITETVSRYCNGRSSCWFTASTDVWSDLCPGTNKYAEVDYACLRCENVYPDDVCDSMAMVGRCEEENGLIMNSCFKTCSGCALETDNCVNTEDDIICDEEVMKGLCDNMDLAQGCARSCRACSAPTMSTTPTMTSTVEPTTTSPQPTTTRAMSTEPTSTVSTSTEPTTTVSTPTEPTSTVSTSTEPTTTVSTPTEPTSTVSTSTEPTTTVATPTEPTSTISTSNMPTSTIATSTESAVSMSTESSTVTTQNTTESTTRTTTLTPEQMRCLNNDCEHGVCVSPGLTDYYDGMQYRCVCEREYTGILCNVVKDTACDWCNSVSGRLCVTSVSSMYGSFCYNTSTWKHIPHPNA